MSRLGKAIGRNCTLAGGLLVLVGLGCASPIRRIPETIPPLPAQEVARELDMVTLPEYTLAPPDQLIIESARLAPKAPYTISPLDILQIIAANTQANEPIAGPYQVSLDGTVTLGPTSGSVKVVDMTLDEAAVAIDEQLSKTLADPAQSAVTLFELAGVQQVAGDHLIGPDGTVTLGSYGTVYVTGMTTAEAAEAIEEHLRQFVEDASVSVTVAGYNSQGYYVMLQGAGFGDRLVRIPSTGNETVMDALAQVQGLSQLSSKRIWIARPSRQGQGIDQILPVNWYEIAHGGGTSTNYQVLPGDRIFIAEDRLIAVGSFVNKIVTPIENLFGFTLLGTQTIQTVNRFPNGAPPGNVL